MATALNMTMRLKQDPASRRKLDAFKRDFALGVQPRIDEALRRSQIVHFARVVVIDDAYVQVLTEFDGDERAYTDFFRLELPDVFARIFELVDGAPEPRDLDPDEFYAFSARQNVRSLGRDEESGEGYLFSAYGTRTVKEMLEASPSPVTPAR
jgi:hypothetical protein